MTARYDPPAELIYDICRDIAGGAHFKTIAADLVVDQVTLRRWIQADAERRELFAEARRERAHTIFDELEDIIAEAMDCRDKVQIQAYRLKIDTYKWAAAKLFPREYGERLQTEVSGELKTGTLSDDELEARLAALLVKQAQA